jgi:hypothetical protein
MLRPENLPYLSPCSPTFRSKQSNFIPMSRLNLAELPLPSELATTSTESSNHEATNWLPVFTKDSSSTTGSLSSQQSSLDQTHIPHTTSDDIATSSLQNDLSIWLARAGKDTPTADELKLEAVRKELAYRWASASFTINRQAIGIVSDSSPPIDVRATRERYDKAARILNNEEKKPVPDVLKEYEDFLSSVMAEHEQDNS